MIITDELLKKAGAEVGPMNGYEGLSPDADHFAWFKAMHEAITRAADQVNAEGQIEGTQEQTHVRTFPPSKDAKSSGRPAASSAPQSSQPVPVEPDYWNKLAKEHYWENEAKRYAGNSDYWRERAQQAESRNKRLVDGLRLAIKQNECDMVLTGDELRGLNELLREVEK